MDKRITINYLILTFLVTYILWGFIAFACKVGYFQFGTPISMILFAIGGNSPPIAAYFILKKQVKYLALRALRRKLFQLSANLNITLLL